jgi:hypothetical protein
MMALNLPGRLLLVYCRRQFGFVNNLLFMNAKNNLPRIFVIFNLICAACPQAQAYVPPPGPPANSPPYLDQSEPLWGSSSYIYGDVSMAQTFTPAIGGILTRLDLCLSPNGPTTGPLLISIDTTENGVPQSALGLTTLTGPLAGVWAWYSFDLSSLSIDLTTGQTYAIVLSAPNTVYAITSEGTTDDSYSGGNSLVQNGVGAPWQTYTREEDLAFQTFMSPVPEPPSRSVLILAAICLYCMRLVPLAKLSRRLHGEQIKFHQSPPRTGQCPGLPAPSV